MRLLGVTDLHDNHTALARILQQAGPVDVILLGGDLTNFGAPGDAKRLMDLVRPSGARVLAVAGNCDSMDIEQWLVDQDLSLFCRGTVVEDVGFHGLSAMPPWHPGMYHFTETELSQSLQIGYGQIAGTAWHVVLSHPPPRATHVDRTQRGQNVGSTALRDFIDRVQPHLVVCGHIHEGRGVECIGRTQVVNCGAAVAGSYAIIEIGEQIHVELRNAQ